MNTQFSKKDTNIVKGVAIIAMLFHHCYVTNINFKAHGVSFAPFSKGTVDFKWFLADLYSCDCWM